MYLFYLLFICSSLWFSSQYLLPPPCSVWPHLFRGAGHKKRSGEQLKRSLAFGLYIEVFHVHSYQDQFIQPGWAESVFLCFVCSFVPFDLFVCPHSFVFPWAVESSPLQCGASITNLNEPPRALAASTIAWVRS